MFLRAGRESSAWRTRDDTQRQPPRSLSARNKPAPCNTRPSRRSTATRSLDSPIRILFLAANPVDTPALRLDEEIRAIDGALREAEFRDRFEIRQEWATRIGDLQEALLRHDPDIVHFSGHGTEASEIVLTSATGAGEPVPREALGRLFAVLADHIRCVVLNACYSEGQARRSRSTSIASSG